MVPTEYCLCPVKGSVNLMSIIFGINHYHFGDTALTFDKC